MGASYHVWVYQVIIRIKKLYRLFLFQKSRGRKKNELGLGTAALAQPQREVGRTNAREGEERNQGGPPHFSRAQNPCSFSFKGPISIGSVFQLLLLTVLRILGKHVNFLFYILSPTPFFSISLVIILTPTLTVMILISVQPKM